MLQPFAQIELSFGIPLQPGKLLGTKGACIASIRKQTGAGIKLAQDLADIVADGIEGVAPGDRLLTISGPATAILSAASECAMKLLESQVMDPTQVAAKYSASTEPLLSTEVLHFSCN